MSSRPRHSALLTDLYELTMAAAYLENRVLPVATFELFVRSLPPQRGFLITAGLEQALDYLEDLSFEPAEIAFLREHPVFSGMRDDFFDYLRTFRFTGEVWAIPEGTPVFAGEPLLRVTAPIIEAQVIETFLLAVINFQIMVASKAARVVESAQGRGVVEFGTRRAHGPQAGTLAARAAYIGGCIGTSNVEAGFRYGIPTYGTVAHSFIMAYGRQREGEAFRDFLRLFPRHAVLLLDTYDTLPALETVIEMDMQPPAVRLDSGNIVELSQQVRARLDQAGLRETRIFVSGDLNEFLIADLLEQGAVIDSFGVGTELATSRDAPSLGAVYKLVEVTEQHGPGYRVKLSEEKATYPGRKQVRRFSAAGGQYERDVIALESEELSGGDPLLVPVMSEGRRLAPSPSLPQVREGCADALRRLPQAVRRMRDFSTYPVSYSPSLEQIVADARRRVNGVTESNPLRGS